MANPADPDSIDLNLDTFEYEKPAEPFTFVWHERRIVMKDPQDLDVFELAELRVEDPAGFFQKCLTPEDFAFMAEHPLTGRQFGVLIERFGRHTGVIQPGKLGASRTY